MVSYARSPAHYSTGAIILHWLIATLIIANVAIVWGAHNVFPKADHKLLMGLHKEFGISVLALSVLRIVWRLTHRPPPLSGALRPWERGLAHATHTLFYLLMVGIPLTGWLLISASSFNTVNMFGLFTLPPLPVSGHGVHETLEGIHEKLGWLIVILLGLHVAGALKHQFLDRDATLGRMIPGLARR